MKAKRRQELKTNTLAQTLDELRQSVRQWGAYLVGGVAVVVVVYAISTSMRSARSAQLDTAYEELNKAGQLAPGGIRKDDSELLASLDKMKQLASDSPNPDFKLDAMNQRGEVALYVASLDATTSPKPYLEQARDSFEYIISNFPDRKIYVGRAHYGLFQVEAGLFAIDQDASHKAVARKHLEAIRNDSAQAGTPLMMAALDRLNEIDALFTPVTFAKAPPSSKPGVDTGAGGTPQAGQGPASSVTIKGGESVTVQPAEPPVRTGGVDDTGGPEGGDKADRPSSNSSAESKEAAGAPDATRTPADDADGKTGSAPETDDDDSERADQNDAGASAPNP